MREDGTLPPHVVYKIRQNATFTHSTKKIRPSYWFPGPMNWGYNYYQYGFVWIQVCYIYLASPLKSITSESKRGANADSPAPTDIPTQWKWKWTFTRVSPFGDSLGTCSQLIFTGFMYLLKTLSTR